ncbi:urea ABC transporter permease subunit UrtC [Celerinatantimonas sp. MCCC 1A17872]|uniref:urea ABC transporter permease subunit UrtC n=1 Tax=Celerinatantimonas sp. MCCC 1A17872 TaxID=3177514 RepID=UPI0038C6ED64
MVKSSSNRALHYFIIVLLAASVITALSHLLLPAGSPFAASTYTITLLGKYLCYALLALAVDIIWGYCGILSLGHGAFFALGGYGMGMYLMRQIGDRGAYGNAQLPDFMVFLNWHHLPWYWTGSEHFWVMILIVLLVPGILAFVFASLAFRSRVTGVYLSIMTQALTYALMLAFFRNEMGFGGNNGMTDFKGILGFDLHADSTRVCLFLITAIVLAAALWVSYKLMQSRFGKIIIAIRDGESRARFLGYRTEHFKVALFVFSSLLAAIAGALYVPQVGIINPSEFSPINSIEMVIWVAVGGRGSLFGAIIGAILVNYAKTNLTAILPDAWLFILGGLFVLVTIFLPKGLMGLWHARRRKSAMQVQA